MEIFSEMLSKKLPDEAQLKLVRRITLEEVKATMFAIKGEKAPGPDGYTTQFFKAAWFIVRREV